MFTSGTTRGALWLAGGILATILGAATDQVFDDRTVAVTVGVVVAVAFGAAIELMVVALDRRFGPPTASSPSAQEPVDEVRAGDQTG